MNEANARTLGDFIGRYLYCVDDTLPHRARHFLLIRVDFNTLSRLSSGCFIKNEDETRLWIWFRYERLPDFCYSCGFLDYTELACSLWKSTSEQDSALRPVYVEWLRAGRGGFAHGSHAQSAHSSKKSNGGSCSPAGMHPTPPTLVAGSGTCPPPPPSAPLVPAPTVTS